MLPPTLKLKVIQQYEAGKLQKDIANELGISTGSVSTILKASKDKQKYEDSIPRDTVQIISQRGPSPAGIGQNESGQVSIPLTTGERPSSSPSPDDTITYTGIGINNKGSSSSNICPQNIDGDEPKPAKSIDALSFPPFGVSFCNSSTPVTPRNGGPLSHLLNEDTAAPESPRMQVNNNDVNYINNYVKEDEEFETSFEGEQKSPEFSASTTSNQRPSVVVEEENGKPLVDYDSDENYARRLWARIQEETNRIIYEKQELKKEWFLINKEKELIGYERQNIQLERQQLQYEQHHLETRLQEVNKYRDLLPSAKELRDMGVDFQSIIIWMEVIKNKVAIEGITTSEAVTLIVQDLRSYSQLNSLQQSVTQAQQNLEALNMVIQEKKQAFASLVDLQNKHDITATELIDLNNIVKSWNGEIQNNGSAYNNVIKGLDDKLNLAS